MIFLNHLPTSTLETETEKSWLKDRIVRYTYLRGLRFKKKSLWSQPLSKQFFSHKSQDLKKNFYSLFWVSLSFLH